MKKCVQKILFYYCHYYYDNLTGDDGQVVFLHFSYIVVCGTKAAIPKLFWDKSVKREDIKLFVHLSI